MRRPLATLLLFLADATVACAHVAITKEICAIFTTEALEFINLCAAVVVSSHMVDRLIVSDVALE